MFSRQSLQYLNQARRYSTGCIQNLAILGVPFSKGQGKSGVEFAPNILRKYGLVEMLEEVSNENLKIKDYGNLKFSPHLVSETSKSFLHVKNYAEFMGCNRALILKVQEMLMENEQFLIIGGDHAIGFGSVAGHLQYNPNLSVVWVDAHADINLHSTSTSGHIHGMPVSCLLKELRVFWKYANLDEIAPNCLAADQLFYIGLRDIDPYEAYILNKLGIKAFAMDAIDKHGIGKIIEMVLDAVNSRNKIHVSFDIDALDVDFAPSTGTIVEGGLTLREGITIVEALRETNRVQGIDLVELNPNLGSDSDVKKTLQTSMTILKSLCGYKRGGNIPNITNSYFEQKFGSSL